MQYIYINQSEKRVASFYKNRKMSHERLRNTVNFGYKRCGYKGFSLTGGYFKWSQ